MTFAAVLALFLLAGPAVVVQDKPVTATVPVSEKLRAAPVVLLHLEEVTLSRKAPVVWNMFWEWPQATERTPRSDAHFVGYIASPPNSALKNPKPANYVVELPSAALKAMRRLPELRITFVPVGKLPPGGITISRLRLE